MCTNAYRLFNSALLSAWHCVSVVDSSRFVRDRVTLFDRIFSCVIFCEEKRKATVMQRTERWRIDIGSQLISLCCAKVAFWKASAKVLFAPFMYEMHASRVNNEQLGFIWKRSRASFCTDYASKISFVCYILYNCTYIYARHLCLFFARYLALP